MNIRAAIIAVALAALAAVDATTINHDQVQPFAQPEPVTVSEKAAIKFKPSTTIVDICHPYPAVNAAGETSGGLKPSGPATGDCKGSGLGSQIYGRAGWYDDVWAIMYAWYLPKSNDKGLRHEWESIVVWLDNPALESQTIKGVSLWIDDAYRTDPTVFTDPASTNTRYASSAVNLGEMALTEPIGEFQDLIMWEQLTDAARASLENTDFGKSMVPFKEAIFQENLQRSRPKYQVKHRINKIWYWVNASDVASGEGEA